MKNDPDFREPRWPSVVIWTVIGALVGVAFWVVVGVSLAIPIAAVLGLGYGMFTTRVKHIPSDD